MLNKENSIHRLLPGRIKLNSEYTLDNNNHVVKYKINIEHKHEGVSSFIPREFPHMLPMIDGACHSTLPQTLQDHKLAAYPDGDICFLERGPHKYRKKAKHYVDAVKCPHYLIYVTDSFPGNLSLETFANLLSDKENIWTKCTKLKAESGSVKLVDNNSDEDDDLVLESNVLLA